MPKQEAAVTKELVSLVTDIKKMAITDDRLRAVTCYLVGAIYSLNQAEISGFRDNISVSSNKKFNDCMSLLSDGKLSPDQVWLAGFYFNSAQVRLAAVYERLLKMLVHGHLNLSEKEEREVFINISGLECLAKKTSSFLSEDYKEARKIHSNVNKLKHDVLGHYKERKVNFEQSVKAAKQLCSLLKMTNNVAASNAEKS